MPLENCQGFRISEVSDVTLGDWFRAVRTIGHAAASNAHTKGFHKARLAHDKGLEDISDMIAAALIASEVGELVDAMRDARESIKIPGFLGIEEEAADIIIRVLEWGASRGLDLGPAVIAKMTYNAGRPALHGGKKL